MKKLTKIFCEASLAFLAFAFTSCADAIVNDGSNVRSYVDSSNSGASGGVIPFSKFEGCDLQIWENTFTATTTTEGLVITVGSVGWWGGAFVNNGAVGPTDSGVVTYDMSNVSKITFEAKISAAGDIWISTSDSNSNAGAARGKSFTLTTEWSESPYEFEISEGTNKVSANDYGVLAIGGGNSEGTTITLKNIAFYDASGNEIVPGVNN